MLWFFTTFDETTPVWIVAIAQTVLSLGLAMSFTPLFTASLASLQPQVLLVRLRRRRHRAAGRRRRGHRAHDRDLLGRPGDRRSRREPRRSRRVPRARRRRSVIAAIVSLPLLVGAFFIRKPADAAVGAPLAH